MVERQLSIIRDDWFLPMMLINNEMDNLPASRSISHSLAVALTLKWNNLLYC